MKVSDTGQATYTAPVNTGGAAFPGGQFEPQHGGSNDLEPWNHGMTLRDYFAAKAMASIITADGVQYAVATAAHAKWAYEQADAMLAARGETK